ncbi:hypothetical protein LINPERHAP2_LOCUS11755 [Linum perenne]
MLDTLFHLVSIL